MPADFFLRKKANEQQRDLKRNDTHDGVGEKKEKQQLFLCIWSRSNEPKDFFYVEIKFIVIIFPMSRKRYFHNKKSSVTRWHKKEFVYKQKGFVHVLFTVINDSAAAPLSNAKYKLSNSHFAISLLRGIDTSRWAEVGNVVVKLNKFTSIQIFQSKVESIPLTSPFKCHLMPVDCRCVTWVMARSKHSFSTSQHGGFAIYMFKGAVRFA